MQDLIEDNIENTGFMKVKPEFGVLEFLMCPAHCSMHLPQNNLQQFPFEKFGLFAIFVASLQLEENLLTTLPDNFFVSFPNLVDIDLACNRLTCLPPGIGHCKQLRWTRWLLFSWI